MLNACQVKLNIEIELYRTTKHENAVTPPKYPSIFIIKIIIYSGYNWANLGIFLGIVG